jgi:hypothetical protein
MTIMPALSGYGATHCFSDDVIRRRFHEIEAQDGEQIRFDKAP